jgi:hypothetical protein
VSLTANPSSIIHTTGVNLVTTNVKDSTGAVVTGVSVTFTRTGGELVGASPVTTDGNGNAVANYSSAHTSAKSDIVKASTIIGGVTYTGATTITVP